MSIINPMRFKNPFKTFSPVIFAMLLLEVACGILLMLGSVAGIGVLGAFHHIASTYHGQIVEASASLVTIDLENLIQKAVNKEKERWQKQGITADDLLKARFSPDAWHYNYADRQLNIVSGETSVMMTLSEAGIPLRELVNPEADILPAYPGYSLPRLPEGLRWNIDRVVAGEKSAWLVWAMSEGSHAGVWGFRIGQEELRPELVKLLRRRCSDNHMKIALVDAQKNRLLTVNYQGELATATAFSPGTSQIFVESSLGRVFDGLSLQIVYTPYIFGQIPAWGYQLILVIIGLVGALLVSGIVYFYGLDRASSRQLQLQNDWVLNLAHSLRGPCHSLGVLTEAMQANAGADSGELYALARRELETMDNRCRQFLQLARREMKASQMPLNSVELRLLVQEAVDRVLLRFPQVAKSAVQVGAMSGINVKADSGAAGEVLMTVIDNALKYSPETKNLVVSAEKTENSIRLIFADSGFGIAADDLEQIATPFYRSCRADIEGINGTGIGLYLAKEACAAMGWQIKISSEGPGKGTSVEFVIPVA